MKLCISRLILTLSLLAALPTASLPQNIVPENTELRTLDTSRGGVTVVEQQTEHSTNGTILSHRGYILYNGDTVTMERLESQNNLSAPVTAQWRLPQSTGMVRWYDTEQGRWLATALRPLTKTASCITITTDDGGETMIYTPKVYENLGSGTLRHQPSLDGSLTVSADGEGYLVQLTVPRLPAGMEAHWTVVTSQEALLDWAGGTDDDFWSAYTLDHDSKWCFDGYYYPSPSLYTPHGDNCYYRLPAAYLVKSFVHGAPAVRAAEDLGIAGLDTMLMQQNTAGYFPTLPISQWLQSSYGIGGGFYDTRFNTDLAEIFYHSSQTLQCAEFDAAMNRYFDFFLDFAANHHVVTAGGGWLVEDYYHPASTRQVHTSLNHQLAEILTLYHFSEQLQREDLAQLAERMLLAVRDTADNWIRSDGDLHYARYPGGTYSETDYPYLTYNDLYLLRAYLSERGRTVPELQQLMDSKRAWMDRNGITGYLK